MKGKIKSTFHDVFHASDVSERKNLQKIVCSNFLFLTCAEPSVGKLVKTLVHRTSVYGGGSRKNLRFLRGLPCFFPT